MTEAIAFDTHRFVKNLTASGFTEKQAEALADEQVHLLEGNLATRTDIANLQVDIRKVRADLLKWMVTAMTAQTAVIVGLIVGFVRF